MGKFRRSNLCEIQAQWIQESRVRRKPRGVHFLDVKQAAGRSCPRSPVQRRAKAKNPKLNQ